ncbi:Maf-domain-containing protein [Tothia fuscella]|uniref:Maf-domain-containing protein n=1 Tax=Tothia fuscella TaxID=1048955 RepID=A0A9P4TWN0_9PEZI|nr:Maf-domain-containing protein [Tothia fuscella]
MADEKKSLLPAEPPPSYEKAVPSPGAPGLAVRPGPPRMPLPLDLPALNMIKGKRVVLASASPRRRQLLAQIGLTQIEIVPSTFAEDLDKSLSAFEYVLQTATQKALNVYKREINNESKGEPALIIAADTVVVSQFGKILEKPRSEAEHIAMLKMLRDTGEHKVYTGVAVMAPLESAKDPGYSLETHVEDTTVKFDPNITDELLLAYVRTREGVDKAGGYGIQGIGSILVERIDGTFDNVVGLPLRATLQLIEKVLAQDDDEEEELNFDR